MTNRDEFILAIKDLRTVNGRNENYKWKNPVKWANISVLLNTVNKEIYGSDEDTINKLISKNITTLIVEQITCSSATLFSFRSMDENESTYWEERWELYKFSYAMAVWAWTKGVTMVEFYNEPGKFLHYIFI